MKKTILLTLFLSIMAGAVEGAEELPRYEPASCPFEDAGEQDDIQCGYLVVPENRNQPGGRVLRLSVAVLKSLSDNPQSDPLVFLSGGPGGPSVKYSVSRLKSSFWTRYRAKRDLVFFDQRGTGFSDPEFCPVYSSCLETALVERCKPRSLFTRRPCLFQLRYVGYQPGIDLAVIGADTIFAEGDRLPIQVAFFLAHR